MDFFRIGDKIISLQKITEVLRDILSERAKGLSQSEVAARLSIDRSFISRLEGLGEVRKGGAIALIGFPLANCEEVREIARQEGVDFVLVMSDEERWRWVRERSGADLLNELMRLIAKVRQYDKVVLVGSDKRIEIMRGLLDRNTEVATIEIGRSPMSGDVVLNLDVLRNVIRAIKG